MIAAQKSAEGIVGGNDPALKTELEVRFIPEGRDATRVELEHRRLDSVPAIVRPLVARMVRGRMRKILWTQGILRHSDADIIEAGLRDWRR